ncbi:hypothetical protein [Quadrisphaera sp. KR29]|uniref:hypothetical protein n=1 Tax=Quadrisphaera sp. KR29 TaxID=3461391 RepID=UPI0040447124
MADETAPRPTHPSGAGQLLSTATGEHPSAPRPAPRGRGAGSVGVLLDGRYRLLQRRTKDGAWATWDGEDDQLLRPVVVAVVSGPTAAEAVDAARRTAALEDERLPHLLDVGLERAVDGTALGWVVTERSPGRTLADLLREAPLPPARARALVGEAAAVLARASRSGLHHRRLEPSAVALTADGAVSVLGLEVAGAAAGLPTRSPAEAEREDAEGLVRVLYAALTGLWPAGRCGALGAAPTGRGGSPVTPGELAAGVPHDLDALCAAVLGPYREGPATPADVAAALAPWGSSTGPVTRTGLGMPATPPPAAPGATAAAGTAAASAAGWASSPARSRLGGGPGLHHAGVPSSTGAADGAEPVAHPTRAARRAAQRRAEREAERAAGGDAFEALLGPVTGPRPQLAQDPQHGWGAAPGREPEHGPSAPAPAPAVTAPLTEDAEDAVGADAAASWRPTPTDDGLQHRPHAAGSAPAARAARSAPPAPTAAVRRPRAPVATAPFSDTDTTDWVSQGWGHAPAGAAPAAGARRAGRDSDDGAQARRGRRGPVVAVLVVLVLALVVAVLLLWPRVPQLAGALGIAPSDTAAPGPSGPGAAGLASPAAQEPAAPADAEVPADAAGGAAEVTAARAEDPFGDSTENDAAASRAVDGDPTTAWRSSTYSNAALGNLKRGVGLSLQLGDGRGDAAVTALVLRTEGSGGRLEVRTSPDGGYEGSTVVATTAAGTDGRTVEVPLEPGTSASHLLLWFTELPQTPTGYTAAVAEASAR